MPVSIVEIKAAFASRLYIFTTHASNRAAQRGILSVEIEEAIINGEVIEDYPDDKYGPSCLILGKAQNNRFLHIQVSYPPTVKIITVYEPSFSDWEVDLKTRKHHE